MTSYGCVLEMLFCDDFHGGGASLLCMSPCILMLGKSPEVPVKGTWLGRAKSEICKA